MTARGRGSAPTGRRLGVKVKTARRRKTSSTRWLRRQLNDPYVAEAGRRGYRSRAAWKLAQLDDRFRILARGGRVVDLGAAPGGWTQVAVERVRPGGRGPGLVLAVDRVEMEPVPGAGFVLLDILDDDAPERLEAALGGPADVVLSDMSPSTTGHRGTDQLRSMMLCEAAHAIARAVLSSGGALIMKVFQGGAERDLMAALKRDFARVKHVKPPASRAESAEIYIVATGFRGGDAG